MNKYPIYIVSKGRSESRLTSKILEKMQVSYHIVIEPQEYKEYANVIDSAKILVLPFSNLGQGSIPARNWIWEHAISQKAEKHWILDDNLRNFYRLNHMHRTLFNDPMIFAYCEEFTDRYSNVALSGMNYMMFGCTTLTSKGKPPFKINTRIYSCILIRNDISFRWRGRYNEDTDLSIRALKSGWCTILFNAFLCEKMNTMTMKGGNTESLYKLKEKDGRFLMAQSLQQQHPDIVRIIKKWGRWQHQVNYKIFEKNKLIKNSVNS